MSNYLKHLISHSNFIREALAQLNQLSSDAILFVVNDCNKLIESLTDGDVRRGLNNGYSIEDNIGLFIQENPNYISKGERDLEKVIQFRENNYRVIPIVDSQKI